MRALCSSAAIGTALAAADPGSLARASSANSLVAVVVATPAKAIPTKLRLDMLVITVFLESMPMDATFRRITHIVCPSALRVTAMAGFERYFLFVLGFAATLTMPLHASEVAAPTDYAIADRVFDEYRLDAHVPGLVYGIVQDGRLVHLGTQGIQDTESKRAVTADTLFRVASMTKAFTALTILKLRDEGKLRLDAPASDYVPELRDWTYPTEDSPRIRIRDLLNHRAGFVTDDPWGDRQT